MVPHRILVVDDELMIRDILKRNLELKGCEIREAGSAVELWQTVGDGWDPEVVFLDIVMPGCSGLKLLGEMKLRFPEAEIVMITSYASVENVQGAMRGGAQDFLSKPFTIPQIWDAVERALAKRAGSPVKLTAFRSEIGK